MNTPPAQPPRDPFPRMILVCIGISMVLLLVIVGVLLADFARRSSQEQRVQPNSPNFFKQQSLPPGVPERP